MFLYLNQEAKEVKKLHQKNRPGAKKTCHHYGLFRVALFTSNTSVKVACATNINFEFWCPKPILWLSK